MGRHVALLRGINVGTAKRVAMADLRGLLEALGCTNVRTVLNSGNAVFDVKAGTPRALAAQIRSGLRAKLGVDAPVMVKRAADFAVAASASAHPLAKVAVDPSRLLVVFTQAAAGLAPVAALTRAKWAPEAFAVGKHAAYMWCPAGVIDSALGKAVARALGDRATTRNWATVGKLNALLADSGA